MTGLRVVEWSCEAAPFEVRQQGTHARHHQHSGRQFHGTCRRNCGQLTIGDDRPSFPPRWSRLAETAPGSPTSSHLFGAVPTWVGSPSPGVTPPAHSAFSQPVGREGADLYSPPSPNMGSLKACTLRRHSQITPRCFSHTFTMAPDSPCEHFKSTVRSSSSFMLLFQPHVQCLLIRLQGGSEHRRHLHTCRPLP